MHLFPFAETNQGEISDAEISALVIGDAVCCDCHGNSQFALINSLDVILDGLKGYDDEVI